MATKVLRGEAQIKTIFVFPFSEKGHKKAIDSRNELVEQGWSFAGADLITEKKVAWYFKKHPEKQKY